MFSGRQRNHQKHHNLSEPHRADQHSLQRIAAAKQELVYAARRRPSSSFQRDDLNTLYEEAKYAETSERKLLKAAELYASAARNGEKIDSCIKDFASIIHQMGETNLAVCFLKEVKPYYRGDMSKFDRLLTTLEKQLQPSVKHHCKQILLELPVAVDESQELLDQLFSNTSRIRKAKFYANLGLNDDKSRKGKWLVLEFQSFSAAKKTMEKFKEEIWFGINRFWLKDKEVMCVATDGRQDFDSSLVLRSEQILEQKAMWLEENQAKASYQEVHNRIAIRLLERLWNERWLNSIEAAAISD